MAFCISVPTAVIKGCMKLNRMCEIKEVFYEILKFLAILFRP